MALIIDPDQLNQGTITNVSDLAFTASAGVQTTLTGAATLPALADNEFFAIRDSSTPGNNGLYQVNDASPTTSSVTADKVSGPNPTNLAAEDTNVYGTTGAASEMSVHFDTGLEECTLFEQGNLSVDGVTKLALHSFIKEEWKADQLLINSGAFPMVGISSAAGQWEWGVDPSGNNNDWALHDDATTTPAINSRRLIRNAGWVENDNAGVVQARFFNVTTLGTFEDVLDQAYYYFGDATGTDNSVDYSFAGPVNEAVKFYDNVTPADGGTGFAITLTTTITRNDGGDWIAEGYVEGGQIEISNAEDPANNGKHLIATVSTSVITTTGLTNNAADTTMTAAVFNDNLFTTNLRIRDADTNGKTFDSANLASAGETSVTAKIIKFPLANATDLDITATDGAIAGTPWSEVRIRYLTTTYNREVDSATKRDFGIVIDVGTYSEANGAAATTSRWDSANHSLGAGELLTDYTGGTLIVHEGVNQGSYTISGTPVDSAGTLQVTVVGTPLTVSGSNESFTVERSAPLTATKNAIYEKIQFQLRQATDIDEGNGTVIGKMVGGLATFVGPDITFGLDQSVNPEGGGNGVIVEGFDANDTNNMFFVDNGGVTRNFPFVAAGNLNFNSNLVTDPGPAEYWLYYEYTNRVTNSDIDTVTPSGDTYDLEGTLGTYVVNDYLRISGFAQAANNGLFIVTVVNVSGSDYTVRRVDGEAVGTAETNQTVSVDENPFNSPDAIIVDNNAGADITGNITGASIAFDFDYDNNVQGGRTAATDANCILKAIGLQIAQFAQVAGLVITRNTGLSFSITAALERNYLNP
jgi:hypothetical protein